MKIIRTPNSAKGGITEDERQQMETITNKWIANAYQTGDCDHAAIKAAIKGLYEVAGLAEPLIVIVPSPLVMACAYGLAAGWRWLQKHDSAAMSAATRAAAYDATVAATSDATYAATDTATVAATDTATYVATRDATVAATDDATYAATDTATVAATVAATYDATVAATSAATVAATSAATDAATRAATYDATVAATYDATVAATVAATSAATVAATDAATDTATRDATVAATYDATYAATATATVDATDDATYDATRAATYDATVAATDTATRDATVAATSAATVAATSAATVAATVAATRDATDDVAVDATWLISLAKKISPGHWEFLLKCCKKWNRVYQGGNMWSASPAYAEACRDVLGLTGLDVWPKYQVWEDAAKISGFRVMHGEFCIVSEFPVEIHHDAEYRPHNANGPSHRWKDGFEIYHLNGVRVPKWLVETPAGQIDPSSALTEKNADVQREIIRKIGPERMCQATNAQMLDTWTDKTGYVYKLLSMEIGENIRRKYLYFAHASLPGVFYAKPVPPETTRAWEGRAWILSLIDRDKLGNCSIKAETRIKAEMPLQVS